MDVLFDGTRINNGDLVSSQPEIMISVKDENTDLLMTDTSAIIITVTDPLGQRQRVSFGDADVDFQPANGDDNTALVFLRPEFTVDGTYTMEVSASDVTGNVAGSEPYRKSFEIINQQTVSNVLAYPNPFTTQTRFVYTLTGSVPPTQFRLQIMTVSGRVVRDIDLASTEDLKIGTHQTEFSWDGTDEYGDQLANGVYLYRMIVSDESGTELEKRDNGTDRFFERGLGKVVLIR